MTDCACSSQQGRQDSNLQPPVAYSNHWFGIANVGGPSPFFPAALGGAVGNTYGGNVAFKNNTDGVTGVTDAADYNVPGANTWKGNWFGSKLGI